jgi:ferric-dicitrate binding protein FerR (iron transport regulator)
MVPRKAESYPELIIQTADGVVSDCGTKFTVSTYGDATQVVLQKGIVKLSVDSTQKTMTLQPGELARFRKSDSQISIIQVDPMVYTSWASNRLVFDHTPLSMLVKRIKHAYGVQVKVEKKGLLKKELSGSVEFGSLNTLINAVNQVLRINITRKGNTIYIRN